MNGFRSVGFFRCSFMLHTDADAGFLVVTVEPTLSFDSFPLVEALIATVLLSSMSIKYVRPDRYPDDRPYDD